MYVWGCCAHRGQQLWDPLELELQKVVSCLTGSGNSMCS